MEHIKSKRVQKYVYIATTQNNAQNDLYTIGSTDTLTIHDNKTTSSNNDTLYYVHTVQTYNAFILERLMHKRLEDFQYTEQPVNSERKWYLLPLSFIVRLIDYTAEQFNKGNDFLEELTNELNKKS